jgi:hypothetical protein
LLVPIVAETNPCNGLTAPLTPISGRNYVLSTQLPTVGALALVVEPPPDPTVQEPPPDRDVLEPPPDPTMTPSEHDRRLTAEPVAIPPPVPEPPPDPSNGRGSRK